MSLGQEQAHYIARLEAQNAALADQRDELLAALKAIHNACLANTAQDYFADRIGGIADAAIRKAEDVTT